MKEIQQSIEDYLKNGGKITKITKEVVHDSPVKIIGYYRRSSQKPWLGRSKKVEKHT